MERTAQGHDLRSVLGVFARRRWIIAAAVLLSLGAATVVSLLAEPVYEARAEVLIQPDRMHSNPEMLGRVVFTAQELVTEQRIATSQTVLRHTTERLGLAPDAADRLEATVLADTRVLAISARDEDPQRASDLAQATAEEYLRFRREEAQATLTAGRERLASQLEQLRAELDRLDTVLEAQDPPDQVIASERATVANQVAATNARLSEMEAVGAEEQGSGRILADAEVPSSPTEPDLVRNLLVALVLGLGLGVVGAIARDSLDEALRSSDDLAAVLGHPMLARVPRFDQAGQGIALVQDPHGPPSEAFRDLRTNLRFVATDLATVTVTSAGEGEGKTTVATNLAAAASMAGFNVLLLDADLRRPSVHEVFGIPNGMGLADVLAESADLSEVLLEFEKPELTVVTAGQIPPNPSELLGSQRMADMLRMLRGRFDLVILDTPPALAASDAQEIASLTDATLIVAHAGTTMQRPLRETRDRMDRAGAAVVGGVLNLVEPDLVSYGYGRYYAKTT